MTKPSAQSEPSPDSADQAGEVAVGTSGARSSPLDAWAAAHWWRPRVVPWFTYMVFLAAMTFAVDYLPEARAPIKLLQIAVVCYLVWRWRKLAPEVNWKFHWLVIPVSLFLTAAWIGLGKLIEPEPDPKLYPPFWGFSDTQPLWQWSAALCHLLAMVTAVPLIEEVFNRSLLLRCLHSAKLTGRGLVQFLCDFPVIGDWLLTTHLGLAVTKQPPAFTEQFNATPIGEISAFGVLASSVVFALVHVPRDWPAAILCGVTWCLLLRHTRNQGLGPVIWSHALVNLLLWAHVIWWGGEEWMFM